MKTNIKCTKIKLKDFNIKFFALTVCKNAYFETFENEKYIFEGGTFDVYFKDGAILFSDNTVLQKFVSANER